MVDQHDLVSAKALAHEQGLADARAGVLELFQDENDPMEEFEGEKPFCRFRYFFDAGDESVGFPGRTYWALAEDQAGTELADLLRLASIGNAAIKIADEAMVELLRGHAMLDGATDGRTFYLVTDKGAECSLLSEADPAINEAFEWLKDRGLAELAKDEHGEYIQLREIARVA